ncbi:MULTISPECIES: hypothetical protein [unclassified Streptomyces]|uniref:hypothetical protein n=1 Tax=unclassified Streptomyces TaxID=2593676 RepID=UPI003669B05D
MAIPHTCPPTCHRCPDLDDDVMPGCLGTAANQGTPETLRLLTWCTCTAALPTEDSLTARIAHLEARVTELENRA